MQMQTLPQASRTYLALAGLCLGLHAASAQCAAPRQDPEAIRQLVQAYALQETKTLPGKVELSFQIPDARVNLAPCVALEAALAPGSRWWGKANVAVRCVAGANWTLYVPVQVRVLGQYVAAARALTPNQSLAAGDLMWQSGDLTQAGAGVITDMAQAIGKSLAVGLAAGQALRPEGLRASQVLAQGQSVRLISKGPGFSVSTEAKTLSSAREGQTVQVKTASNQVVTGVARVGGLVEVNF